MGLAISRTCGLARFFFLPNGGRGGRTEGDFSIILRWDSPSLSSGYARCGGYGGAIPLFLRKKKGEPAQRERADPEDSP